MIGFGCVSLFNLVGCDAVKHFMIRTFCQHENSLPKLYFLFCKNVLFVFPTICVFLEKCSERFSKMFREFFSESPPPFYPRAKRALLPCYSPFKKREERLFSSKKTTPYQHPFPSIFPFPISHSSRDLSFSKHTPQVERTEEA